MKKILVPVDFSDTSIHALHAACQLAIRTGADLFLLNANEMAAYVVPVSEYAYTASALDVAEYNKTANERIQNLKSGLLSDSRFKHLNIITAVREGLMVPVIREVIKEEGIDLIVMGTLGVSGWKELLIGSNTERVIRYAPCPVLVIPKGIDELKINRVVVPSNLKPDQKNAFKMVKKWQEIFGFEVHALYLNDPLGAMTHVDIEAEKNRQMAAAGLRNVYLHLYGMTIDAEDAIRKYAQQVNADMIIMGTHQPRGLSHLLFGSLTEDTANHSPVPVLSVPV
jgi:nucleotide-binding universal stress UspA family protein